MNETTYRPLAKQDRLVIKSLISDSFYLDRYISEPRVLELWKHAYLQGCLAEQTFTRVAERGGTPVGIIMCSTKSRYRLLSHLPFLGAALCHHLRMSAASRRYSIMHAIMTGLRNGGCRLLQEFAGLCIGTTSKRPGRS